MVWIRASGVRAKPERRFLSFSMPKLKEPDHPQQITGVARPPSRIELHHLPQIISPFLSHRIDSVYLRSCFPLEFRNLPSSWQVSVPKCKSACCSQCGTWLLVAGSFTSRNIVTDCFSTQYEPHHHSLHDAGIEENPLRQPRRSPWGSWSVHRVEHPDRRYLLHRRTEDQ